MSQEDDDVKACYLHSAQLISHNRIEVEISAATSLLEQTNTSQISFNICAWLQPPDVANNYYALYTKTLTRYSVVVSQKRH
jgi:hypothetical protein